MNYTGKLTGYIRKVEGTTDGTINVVEDGVNYRLLDQLVEQHPVVNITIEESKSRMFCTGVISSIYDWERSCIIGTLLIALLILNECYGVTMVNSNQFLLTAIISIDILLTAWSLISDYSRYRLNEDFRNWMWNCIGNGAGFIIGFIILKVLINLICFLSVEGFFNVWLIFGCLRTVCAFVRDIILC